MKKIYKNKLVIMCTYSSFTLLDFVSLALKWEQNQFGTVLLETFNINL